MGLPNLRSSAFCPNDVVQAAYILQEAISYARTCGLGYGTELCVLGDVHCHLPEYVFSHSVCPLHDMSFVAWVCFKHYLYRVLSSQTLFKLPQKIIDFFSSKYSYGLGGFFGALSLFVEEKRRRGELAMYVLPKSLESAWLTARGKGWVFHTGHFGEMIVSTSFRV